MSDVINNSNDIKQKCAFILLAITDDDKCEKPSLATCYGGTRDRLANLIELLCSNDSRCMDFVTKGTQNACIRNSYKRHQ